MYFSNKETMFIFKLDHPALYVSKVHFININVISMERIKHTQ